MNLSPQQAQAMDKIMAWYTRGASAGKRFVLAGCAGAGKTTLARLIAERIGADSVAFCAYTGKAANVLREKGCENSGTIHSWTYHLVEGEEPKFEINPDSKLKQMKLVIVDEYSMLPADIRKDLEGLSRRVLYLGDPFQLPPVQGECDLKPDFFIEEIHRQALESPIIRFATDVRTGKRLSFCNLPEFLYDKRGQIAVEEYENADQIIVGRNDTRIAWNNRFRQKLGFDGSPFPLEGDKIICTKNNRQEGLFNGMIGEATGNAEPDEENADAILVHFDEYRGLKTWGGNFRGDEGKCPMYLSYLNRFDFAYAITCHKSQGSEFDTVLIYEQTIGKDPTDRSRWLYTAITRAKQRVILVKP